MNIFDCGRYKNFFIPLPPLSGVYMRDLFCLTFDLGVVSDSRRRLGTVAALIIFAIVASAILIWIAKSLKPNGKTCVCYFTQYSSEFGVQWFRK